MTEPLKPPETSQTTAAKESSRPRKGLLGLAIITLVISVVVGTGGYFLGWPYVTKQWYRFTDLERQLEEIRAVVKQHPEVSASQSVASEARMRSLLDVEQRDWEQTLERLRDEIDAELAAARNQSALRVGRLEQQVDRLLAVDRRAWLGHEAAFLLRLANQRLLVARDIDAAMALLAQADELLRATDAPIYETVRMSIAQDHANLAATPKVDEVGLYARLAALIDQVEQLQLEYERPASAIEDQALLDQKVVTQQGLDGVESSWHKAINKLSTYLVIRRSNEEIAALMTPEWAALARQNLRMLLEQSQIAMLTANANLYQQSLQRSERFTDLFAQYDPDRVQRIRGEIQALQRYDIAPQLPDMVLARSLLDSELETRQADGALTMTRFNLYLVIGLLFGAILAILISEDSGYVLLRWRGWQLETSIWLAVGLLLLIVVTLALLRKFFRSTVRIPIRLRHWLGLRSARGAQRQTDKGLAAFFEGRWDVAERALRKVQFSETRTLLHPLYTAIAAYRKGQHDQAKALLSSAEVGSDTPKHLVLMTQAECHLAMEDYDGARQALDGLTVSDQALPRGKKLLAQMAYAQKEWTELISLTADLRGRHQLPEMLLDIWEREAYYALLSDEARSSKELLMRWRQAPAGLKEEGGEAWAIVTRNLIGREDWDLLQKMLIERLSDHYDTASMDAVHAFPDRQGAKLQKVLRQWIDKDLDGQCHAALACIAEHDGRTEEAGALWQQAYSLGKLPRFGIQWSRWLRQEGEEAQAVMIEKEALSQLQAR